MRRLRGELVERTRAYAHRVVDVAEELDAQSKRRRVVARIVDQLVGCGTSVGANTREADEAMSRPDFCKALGIVLKELGEGEFWLSFVADRGWIPSQRLDELRKENRELTRIMHVIVGRTKANARSVAPREKISKYPGTR